MGIDHFQLVSARGLDDSTISNLTTGFAIKRGLCSNEIHLFTFTHLFFSLPLCIERNDSRLRIETVITNKLDLFGQLDFNIALEDFPRLPSATSLLLH